MQPCNVIKAIIIFLICLFGLILFGCANTVAINNIRQTDISVQKTSVEELKFMTFNIRAGGGIVNPDMSPKNVMATEENLIKLVDAIDSVNPDIVGLQEVRGFNQAKFIAEKLDMNFAYIVHANSNWWGLALLSKFTIVEIKTKLINSRPDSRIALMSKIDVNGKTINVLNVHYALENYYGQVKSTMSFIEAEEGPLVLMGDLNRQPYDDELKPIQEKFVDTCNAVKSKDTDEVMYLGTLSLILFANRIDYIFIDTDYFRTINAGLVPKKHRFSSDHVAYWAKLRIRN